jgi:hypothetical protein
MEKKLAEYSTDEKYAITEIAKCKPNMHYITLTDDELAKIDTFAKQKAIAKLGEAHHMCDGGQEYKRNYTGMMGEVALEKFFGTPFVDWSVGTSDKYNVADLRPLGYNVGIKTVEMGKFPLVRRDAYRPEIICIKRNENTVIICGLATVDVLIHNQDDKFVRSPNALRRGEKSAFVGFDKLIKINSLNDLVSYKRRYK